MTDKIRRREFIRAVVAGGIISGAFASAKLTDPATGERLADVLYGKEEDIHYKFAAELNSKTETGWLPLTITDEDTDDVTRAIVRRVQDGPLLHEEKLIRPWNRNVTYSLTTYSTKEPVHIEFTHEGNKLVALPYKPALEEQDQKILELLSKQYLNRHWRTRMPDPSFVKHVCEVVSNNTGVKMDAVIYPHYMTYTTMPTRGDKVPQTFSTGHRSLKWIVAPGKIVNEGKLDSFDTSAVKRDLSALTGEGIDLPSHIRNMAKTVDDVKAEPSIRWHNVIGRTLGL